MSQLSAEFLNRMILVGNVAKRREGYYGKDSFIRADGKAWHHDESLQGAESNHYEGPIPQEDVERRLFNFTFEESPIQVKHNGLWIPAPGRKAMVASDTGETVGVFKAGYAPHQFRQWLVENVASILNHETGLAISSAGFTKENRAVAFVQVELPDTVQTKEGVAFRTFLFGTTSFDGSLQTTYKAGNQTIICDNSWAAAMGAAGDVFRRKHTKGSLNLRDAREALQIIVAEQKAFSGKVEQLCQWEVSDAQFAAFLDKLVPMQELGDAPTRGDKKSRTMAENKRESIESLYNSDKRAATWRGNAFGVLQAVSTYDQHESNAAQRRGALRQWDNFSTGKTDESESDALALLAKICERELVAA